MEVSHATQSRIRRRYAVILVLSTAASVWAADFGTAEEAKAMLEKAVAAVKENKAKALNMFNKGEGGLGRVPMVRACSSFRASAGADISR